MNNIYIIIIVCMLNTILARRGDVAMLGGIVGNIKSGVCMCVQRDEVGGLCV